MINKEMEQQLLGSQDSRGEDMEGRWPARIMISNISSFPHFTSSDFILLYKGFLLNKSENKRGSKISIRSVKKGIEFETLVNGELQSPGSSLLHTTDIQQHDIYIYALVFACD